MVMPAGVGPALGLAAGRNWSLGFDRSRSRLPGTQLWYCAGHRGRAWPGSWAVGTYTLVTATFLEENQGLGRRTMCADSDTSA